MASAIMGGLIKQAFVPSSLYAIDPDESARERISRTFDIRTGSCIDGALDSFNTIVLAVKPQILPRVCEELKPILSDHLVISIAAGVGAAHIAQWLGGYDRVVRAMPNTPAMIGMGVTGLTALPAVTDAQRARVTALMGSVGEVVWMNDEAQIDAVTAISGSGPAYVFYFMEAMQSAAQRLGLDEKQGRALVFATFAGSVQLAARSDQSVEDLRQRVTSKGGTTAAAISSFDTSKVNESIVQGILHAYSRSIEMREMSPDRPLA
jgi:pyrroline-5-carboxylate reductase